MSSELQKLETEFEAKSEITKVFTSKLNILDFIANKLSKSEYQRVVNVIVSELENIVKTKTNEEKLQFYTDLKNVFNYSFNEYEFVVGFSKAGNSVVDLSTQSKMYASRRYIYLSEESKEEIFFLKYDKDDKVCKIYVKFDLTDKYKNILYTALKSLQYDTYMLIHYFHNNNNTYMMLDVGINYNDLINNKIINHDLGDNNKIIHSYTIEDFVKLWKDGYVLYNLFGGMTNQKFTMCISKQFKDELKYFKYGGKVYAIDYDQYAKKLFAHKI